jgi:UDP-N-acetylglucosamine 2-epimerase (non-hydrolysing)
VKISVIFGTRPEAIKLAPVILKLRKHSGIDCHVCVTAQHREMLDQVLEVFDIIPDTDLNLMEPHQTLATLTSKACREIDGYLSKEKPDMVLVQGDTTTTFVASLAGFYHHITIGHVEAGLRTGNLQSPWPEEANRVLTTRLASLHFAPTENNRRNLLNEGIVPSNIFVTGNTIIDALFMAIDKVKADPPDIPGLRLSLNEDNEDPQLVLITGHRRESFGEGLRSICKAIITLATCFPQVHFIYPVHMNPNVRTTVMKMSTARTAANIHLLEPLPYLPFVWLMRRSTLILTDSGGIQEEALSLKKPVLVMRNTTERPEGVAAGAVKLVETDTNKIIDETAHLLTNREAYECMTTGVNPYGDGNAAERIVRAIVETTPQSGDV